jgi:photosystem II stability/assembly factor-like uncharacterized protein
MFSASLLLTAAFLAQWTPITAPATKASLRGLSAVNAKVAWTSGAGGAIFLTVDGGRTWQGRSIAGNLDFRDIQAFDEKTAVAMSAGPGAQSRIYRTEDGGAQWTLTHQNKQDKGFYDSIAFWDRRRGILVGDPVDGKFTILTTSNGGVTWQPIPAAGMPAANEGEGAFAASGTSITVQPGGKVWFGTGGKLGGRVFLSEDWGRAWTVVQTPIRHDSESSGIFSILFRDARNGVAVGGDYRKLKEASGTMIVSSDGGRTWTLANGLTGFRSAIVTMQQVWLATGPEGSDFSEDGGRNWRSIPSPGYHSLSKSFASGFDGRVSKVKVLE